MNQHMTLHIIARIYGEKKCFGPGVAQLLQAVEEVHSLRAAAKTMNMAYSKAWTIVKTAEEGFGCKLLDVSIGGPAGGGAVLTQEAKQIMAAYTEYTRRLDQYGQQLYRELFPFCIGETEEE